MLIDRDGNDGSSCVLPSIRDREAQLGKFKRRWSSCLGLIHSPIDPPLRTDNLCSLMDAITGCVHRCGEARGCWQSQDGSGCCCCWCLSEELVSVWTGNGYLALPSVERPAEIYEPGPRGGCHLHLLQPFFSVSNLLWLHLWSLWGWVSWLPPCCLFHLFTLSPLLPSSSFSSLPPPFLPVVHSGAMQRLSWPHASRSIGPIVYSLHPDTKDIRLSDQRAGARARLINEALGREEEEGGMDGGRQLDRWADRHTISPAIDGNFCWAQIRGSSSPRTHSQIFPDRSFCFLSSWAFCCSRWLHQKQKTQHINGEITSDSSVYSAWLYKSWNKPWDFLIRSDKCSLCNENVWIRVWRGAIDWAHSGLCLSVYHCNSPDSIDSIYQKTVGTTVCLLKLYTALTWKYNPSIKHSTAWK